MQYVRKEHYVPQFYLRKFANNKGLLHIYDFEKNNFFKQCPNNMCYKKDLYETKWGEDNSKFGEFVLQNCIEKKFGEYEIEFSNVLSNMNYTFLCVPDDLFITSDIPFCIGDDFIINENNKTGIYLALSPKVVVIFGNYKNSKKYRNRNICISKEQADKFNNFFVNNNHDKRFLIANSKMILKKYVDMIKQ